jgi:hypothetical protein
VTLGQTLHVTFHGDGDPHGQVALVASGTGRAAQERSTGGASDGRLEFPTTDLRPA